MITLIAAATLSPTTLDNAFLVAAVYALVQWIIKPLIVSFWLPQNNPYQDNATRAAGFLVAFVLTLINAAVQHPLTAAQAWALLPTAAAIYASSALTYHIATPGSIPAPATNPASAINPVPQANPIPIGVNPATLINPAPLAQPLAAPGDMAEPVVRNA